jgi:hypothetical protein
MSDFVEFVGDNANNQSVGNEFMQQLTKGVSKEELQKWFHTKGYDISLQECQELIIKKDNILALEANVKGY